MDTNNQIQALDRKTLQSRLRDEGLDPVSGYRVEMQQIAVEKPKWK